MSRKIIYKTAEASTATGLDAAVNKLIEDGYQLYGTPYLTDTDGGFIMFQAMTKEEVKTHDMKAINEQILVARQKASAARIPR
jgi:hypothetical protein